jgi:hypothetical protein
MVMLYKGTVTFRKCVAINNEKFGIKIDKLCDSLCYTCGMIVCLGQNVAAQITATHGTVLRVIRRDGGLSHEIFIDNYFSSPAVLDNLFQHKIYACERVCHDRHEMPQDIGPKSRRMESGRGWGRSDTRQRKLQGCSQERQVSDMMHALPTNLVMLSNLV